MSITTEVTKRTVCGREMEVVVATNGTNTVCVPFFAPEPADREYLIAGATRLATSAVDAEGGRS